MSGAFARGWAWWAGRRRAISSELGATSIEYALMIGLIAAVIVVAVAFLGNATSNAFSSVKFP
ncbi:MAG: Flp family type IVb pilin [Actinobacteria bacterium]|nr:Flp family type IVb pilin [Actinomycetota bacterium]